MKNFINKYNLFTLHKICVYLLIVVIVNKLTFNFNFGLGLYSIISAILIFLISHRLNNLIISIGVFNAAMYEFVNYHKDSIALDGSIRKGYVIFSFKDNLYGTSERLHKLQNISIELTKIHIWHNEMIRFLYDASLDYMDQSVNKIEKPPMRIEKSKLKFKTEDNFSSPKLVLNWFLVKEILKTF